MKYPKVLAPTTTEGIRLPSGASVQIPKTRPVFELWAGHPPGDTYGNKKILNSSREPAFAEIAILKLFENAGWQGVWVDTYRNHYRTNCFPMNEVELPPREQELLLSIYKKVGTNKGCWDVFCWGGRGRILFAESKRRGHDRIRESQRRWLEGALKCGLPIASFLIVEWSA